MADASNLQVNFQGGEWTPYFQGRVDRPDYRSAMNVCRNAFPIEEGPWTRRPGTQEISPTRGGQPAVVRAFAFSDSNPYDMEFTPGHLEFLSGQNVVLDSAQAVIASISTATPAVLALPTQPNWNTGDLIMIAPQGLDPQANGQNLVGIAWTVTKIDANHYSIVNSVTGAPLNGSTVSLGNSTFSATRILDFLTVYQAADLQQIRVVQANNNGVDVVVVLHPSYPPYVLTNVTSPNPNLQAYGAFTWAAANFLDGPYFDPVADGSYLTPSGTAGQITLAVTYTVWSGTTSYSQGQSVTYSGHSYTSLINGNLNNQPDISSGQWQLNSSGALGINNGAGFKSTDVGRSVRLLSEPALWSVSTPYAIGASVKWNGGYYQALKANTGGGSTNTQPDVDVVDWAVTTSAYTYTWATILTVNSPTSITVQLRGGNLLYTLPIYTYQLGLYSGTTGYPSCGCFSDGRLWLMGAQPNRFDASMSNQIFNMAPTGADGTISDNNSISEVFNANDANTIYWAMPEAQGIICGTKGGEWFISSSNLNDPITPTSIKANRVTKYKASPVPPVKCPLSVVFSQLYGRKMYEYISDVYSGKFSGTNLAISGKHLTVAGIAELAYVQELVPIVWARMNDGTLAGVTYKRESPFGTQPASFSGWHRHDLGTGRTAYSIASGPSQDGSLDSLTLITYDSGTGLYYRELLSQVFDEDTPIQDAWFVDGGMTATAAVWSGAPTGGTITLYGYSNYAGQNLDVWGCGLDLGTHLVSAQGTITLTLDQANSLFTTTVFQSLGTQTFAEQGTIVTNANPQTAQQPVLSGIQQMIPNPAFLSGTVSTNPLMPDFQTGRLPVEVAGSGAGGGLRYFNIYTGVDLNDALASTIYGGRTSGYIQSPACVGYDDNIYMYSSGSNSGVLSQINSAMQLVATFGLDAGSSSIMTSTTAMAWPFTLAALNSGGVNYCVGASIYTQFGNPGWGLGAEITVIATASTTPIQGPAVAGGVHGGTNPPGVIGPNGNGTTQNTSGVMTWLQPPDNARNRFIDEYRGYLCRGETFLKGQHAFGAVYCLGSAGAANSYMSLGLYRISVDNPGSGPAVAIQRIAKIAPNQIDPGWTCIAGTQGTIFDATDKNVIFFAEYIQPAAWSSAASYQPWNPVQGSDGHTYGCQPPAGAPWPGNVNSTLTNVNPASAVWNSATAYVVGNTVKYSISGVNHYFTCLVNNTNVPPVAINAPVYPAGQPYSNGEVISYQQTYWTSAIANNNFSPTAAQGTWAVGTAYTVGSQVLYLGNIYYCLVNNTGNTPSTSPTDWELIYNAYATDWYDYGACWIDQGIPAPAHAQYMIKANTQTGAIMWTIPILNYPSTSWGLNQTRIQFGRLSYLDYNGSNPNACPMLWINTLTGTVLQTTTVPGVTCSTQSFDDYTGLFVAYGGLTPVTGSPTPLGGTPVGGFAGQYFAFLAPAPVSPLSYYAPFVAGKAFVSQGQLLRALSPQEAGAQNGPALAKTRREHQYGVLLQETQGISFGTDFTHLNPANFTLADQITPVPLSTLFSGIHWTSLDDDYSFDGMTAWQISRPYPATVVAVGSFLHTQDR